MYLGVASRNYTSDPGYSLETSRKNEIYKRMPTIEAYDDIKIKYTDTKMCDKITSVPDITKYSNPEQSPYKSRHKNVLFKKAMACFGWLFCCPMMVCGLCLREYPADSSDLNDDACLPCYYDNE